MSVGYNTLVAILVVGGGAYALILVLTRRFRLSRRMSLALGDSGRSRTEGRLAAGAEGFMLRAGAVAATLGGLMPLGEDDRRKILVGLQRADFRSTNALAVMLGIKFSCLLIGFVASMVFLPPLFSAPMGLVAGLIGGVLAGVVLNTIPELVLQWLAKRRLLKVEGGLAELFDLLVVCLESGMTFERALTRTVANLETFQPSVAKALRQVLMDINLHGLTREIALERLAIRLDSQSFRDLATTVGQSERHGTPMADALRKLASSKRVEAIARIQEKMARLPTLLVIPSIACVLPGIIVIIGGPAVFELLDALGDFSAR